MQSQNLNTTPRLGPTFDIQALREENLVLRTENSMLRTANQSLMSIIASRAPVHDTTSSLPQSSRPSDLPSLQESDFPNTKLWQKTKWASKITYNQARSTTQKLSRNSLLFLEHQDGTPPTEEEIKSYRKFCYNFFFDKKSSGSAPRTWGEAGLSFIAEFRSAAERDFPDLRLCSNHWKADQLGSTVFFSWTGTHGAKVKQETEEPNLSDDDDVEIVPSTSKRPATEAGTERLHKRAKKDDPAQPKEGSKEKKRKKRKSPLFGQTPSAPTELLDSLAPPAASADTPSTPASATDSAHPPSSVVISSDPPFLVPALPVAPAPAPAFAPAPTPAFAPAPSPAPAPAVPTPAASSPVVALDSSTIPLPPSNTDSAALNTATALLLLPNTVSDPVLTMPNPTVALPPQPTPKFILPPNRPTTASTTSVTTFNQENKPPAAQKKTKWNPSSKSITPRGLCASDYHRNNPTVLDGSVFDTYWKNLADADKAPWNVRSEQAKAALDKAAKMN
ncbi:hypothetical protein DFH06DRAFT_1371691 [Mycena polygramma]|nr:hypothetical protein DFH06DRAFT_1371691 [Mycena polygramma]